MLYATPPPDSALAASTSMLKMLPTEFYPLRRPRQTRPPETTARNLLNDSQSSSLTLPSTAKDYGGATRWAALRFSACIYLTRGEAELSTRSLAEEMMVFEGTFVRQDGLILAVLHLMVMILQIHDQGDIAESVVRSASVVAERLRAEVILVSSLLPCSARLTAASFTCRCRPSLSPYCPNSNPTHSPIVCGAVVDR
jgi:hypothetical protein